jgi:hypothetical protein
MNANIREYTHGFEIIVRIAVSFEHTTITTRSKTYVHLIVQEPLMMLLQAASDVLNLDVVAVLLEARGHDVSLNGLEVNVGNLRIITVEDLGDLLKGWATSLDVEDADEDELEEDPALAGISML